MRDLLAEVHHRAWTAAAVAGALAVSCAAAHFALPAVLAAMAAMAAGAVLMWTSEEENRVVAAMAPVPAPPAPASASVPAPNRVHSPAPAPALPAPAPGPAVAVREWASPFPASRPARRQRPQPVRRVRRQGGAATTPSD